MFHDLAPHQVDLAYFFFGEAKWVEGIAANQAGIYPADDIVTGNVLFNNGVVFTGTWCFNVASAEARDAFEIFGSDGKISFPVFGKQEITITKNGTESKINFEAPIHVQQPMIEAVVKYFTGNGNNPCSALQGATVMAMMDKMTAGPH